MLDDRRLPAEQRRASSRRVIVCTGEGDDRSRREHRQKAKNSSSAEAAPIVEKGESDCYPTTLLVSARKIAIENSMVHSIGEQESRLGKLNLVLARSVTLKTFAIEICEPKSWFNRSSE